MVALQLGVWALYQSLLCQESAKEIKDCRSVTPGSEHSVYCDSWSPACPPPSLLLTCLPSFPPSFSFTRFLKLSSSSLSLSSFFFPLYFCMYLSAFLSHPLFFSSSAFLSFPLFLLLVSFTFCPLFIVYVPSILHIFFPGFHTFFPFTNTRINSSIA